MDLGRVSRIGHTSLALFAITASSGCGGVYSNRSFQFGNFNGGGGPMVVSMPLVADGTKDDSIAVNAVPVIPFPASPYSDLTGGSVISDLKNPANGTLYTKSTPGGSSAFARVDLFFDAGYTPVPSTFNRIHVQVVGAGGKQAGCAGPIASSSFSLTHWKNSTTPITGVNNIAPNSNLQQVDLLIPINTLVLPADFWTMNMPPQPYTSGGPFTVVTMESTYKSSGPDCSIVRLSFAGAWFEN